MAPMRRVNVFLELLRRDGAGLNERQQQHMGHVFHSVRHLEGLREYARLATAPLRVRPVDLNRVLRDVRKDLAPLLEGREVRLTSDPLPTVQADSLSLQVVLTKLLDNALKFTRTRGVAHIHVGAEERATAFMISVEDNGMGFNNRLKPTLFSVFRRLHPEREFGGHGLGLATVRQVCERLGGQVWAEGRVGEGATFFLSLPKEPTEVF